MESMLEKEYGDDVRLLDGSYDGDLERLIKNDRLNWLPWIGVNWRKAKQRILVVAESHYGAKSGEGAVQEKLDACAADPLFTREVLLETGVGNWYASRLFGNIHRTILRTDNLDAQARASLWGSLAFCNFIQRPMENESARPAPNEFFAGWSRFVDLLRVLRPDVVLFVGVTAACHFDGAMSVLGLEHEIVVDDYRNGAYPRRFSLAYDGKRTEMVAIRHASKYFSWDSWNRYLEKVLPNTISFLRGVAFGGGELSADNGCPMSEDSGIILDGLPLHLNHKPILACDYQEINDALGHCDYDDPKFISIGHAQWNPDELSVKMLRRGDSGRWSRQSEEVPVQRLPYMMEMLLAAIYRIQHSNEDKLNLMGESIVSPQDLDLLKEQMHAWAGLLKPGLSRVKDLMSRINVDNL